MRLDATNFKPLVSVSSIFNSTKMKSDPKIFLTNKIIHIKSTTSASTVTTTVLPLSSDKIIGTENTYLAIDNYKFKFRANSSYIKESVEDINTSTSDAVTPVTTCTDKEETINNNNNENKFISQPPSPPENLLPPPLSSSIFQPPTSLINFPTEKSSISIRF